jgi:hypothetical protein
VLAAIIANLQNVELAPQASLPIVKIDRGGGGPLWGAQYDITDIAAAIAAFPEIAGEDPLRRAARRTRWIGEALPKIKEARERQNTAAFLAGAQVGAAAQREIDEEAQGAAQRLSLEQIVRIIDEVRPAPTRVVVERGSSGPAFAMGLAIGAIGAIGAIALLGKRGRRRRSRVH